MKRFTLGVEDGKPMVLLNGVRQDTPYIPWRSGLRYMDVFGDQRIMGMKSADTDEVHAEKLVAKRALNTKSFELQEWLVMQAKIIRLRACKIRQHRQSSPGTISFIERRMFKVRDLMMCMAR